MSNATAATDVPSPTDVPKYSARQLLREIKRGGGRVFRMREVCVFVLTTNPDLAGFLTKLGGRTYIPRTGNPDLTAPLGSYRRARGEQPEWDIYIHTIPLRGEQTLWDAVGTDWPTVVGTEEEFA